MLYPRGAVHEFGAHRSNDHACEVRDAQGFMNSNSLDVKKTILDPVREARSEWFRRPDTLFHYTTATGLEGIFEDRAIRCTRTDFLNDSSEMQHGIDLFLESVWRHKGGALFMAFQRHCELFDWEDLAIRHPVFVSCFCSESDNLDMWRGYGNAAPAYSMEFGVWPILFNTFGEAELLPVVYEKKRQVDFLNAVVQEIVKQLSSPFFSQYAAANGNGVLFNEILASLWLVFPILKNDGFRSERECRFVVRQDLQSADSKPVKTCIRRNCFIPYVELEFTKNRIGGRDNMPVRSITIGPCADLALAERGLMAFLREHKLSDIEVRRSDLPFRG